MLIRRKIIFILGMLLLVVASFGQTIPDLPKERITGQLSHRILFPGEILWFSLFSSNTLDENKDLSTLSFVELLNENNTSVLRKKVSLKDYCGNSYFELPDTLSTGIYTVVAYTNWMKNFGEELFWKENITIVNPRKTLNSQSKVSENKFSNSNQCNSASWKGKVYGKREQVKINSLVKEQLKDGNYSITIRRKEPVSFKSAEKDNSLTFAKGDKLYLPDYDGTLITGKLFDANNTPAEGERVLLSLPGKRTDLLQSVTGSDGSFKFLLNAKGENSDLVFILPDGESKIKLDDRYYNKFKANNDLKMVLDSTALTFLENKYFYSQLAQKYDLKNSLEKSRETAEGETFIFYNTPNRTFKMENYVRLDSLAEYFHELIPSVRFSRLKNNYDLTVINQKTKLELGPNPGVFIDGVLYSDYNSMAKIPSEDVDRIDVIWEKYHYKDFTFDGIVSLQSKKADFYSVELVENMTRIIYPVTNENRLSFKVVKYNSESLSRREPDLRYLLHWIPKVEMNKVADCVFYTSDVEGLFEISVRGCTREGEFVTYSNEFLVQ